MDDPRTDAPELDLTSIAEDGDDALQVTLSDSVAGDVVLDVFAIDSAPAAPPEPTPVPVEEAAKPHRPNVQLGDDRFVAALLGRPMEAPKKSKKSKVAKPSAGARVATVKDEAPPALETSEAASIPATEPIIVPAPLPAASEPIAPPEAALPEPIAESAVEPVFTVAASVPTTEKSPPRPRPKHRKPAPSAPMASTAPVTVHEPEILDELPTSEVAAAEASEPVALQQANTSALPAEPVVPIVTAATPAKIDTTPVATSGAQAIVPPKPAAPVAAPVPVAAAPTLKPFFASDVLPPPADPDAFARDFALPKLPTRAPAAPAKLANVATFQPAAPKVSAAPVIGPLDMPAADRPATGAWWTLPLMFVGLIMIACALIVPVADENHRAAYELAKIERDVAHFQNQSDVNQSFLSRVSTDPALAERLAMRQLNMIRPDEHFAPLKSRHDAFSMSPFALVSVDPPAPLPAYRPIGGFLSRWFLSPRFQIYAVGLGLLLAAAGIVFGGGGREVPAA